MSKRRIKAYTFLLIATAIWGIAGPTSKFILNNIDPFFFLAYRFAISAVLGILFFVVVKPKIKNPIDTLVKVGFLGGVLYTVSLSLLFVGLSQSSVLDMVLIGSAGPLLVVIGGAYFFREHVTHREKAGALIAFVGVLISAIIPVILQSGIMLSGNILLLFFLLIDSATTLITKRFLRDDMQAVVVTQGALLAAGMVFAVNGIFIYGFEGMISGIGGLTLPLHVAILYMAVMSGSMAYYLYFRGAKTIEISEVALFGYLQPLVSVPLAVIWLGESITPLFINGAIIIAVGIAMASYKKRRLKY